ncbi:LysR family transcriptional regulator [Oscillatoria sp. FACHB-1407]|uniref:LysR substrate-binding domain-containing protein n=1 Tax=Oscillatoria sp. FACHB-1407 TaxID=2692847 RepID=UPI0016857699|nr:LysR substrate-binding domain-containing protein [Oscillatoria sp. FACHB-1407]MBD2465750.1 LysR family transcriptional regulator [Oscillatoria sp. FACHB-1407]
MELRHLRYFLAVAEELNFSQAAKRLHIAQPPLSQQIRDLEDELGVQLLERNKRPLQLTNAGQIFLKEVTTILGQVDQAVRSAQRAGRGEIGRLSIAFSNAATQSILIDILRVFRERFPDIELVLHELNSFQQIQSLQANKIDAGFVYLHQLDSTNIEYRSVTKEPLIVALHEFHPLSMCDRVSLKALAHESFILPPRQLGPGFYHKIIGLCQRAGFEPHVAHEAMWLQTVLSLVAARVGVALVPISTQQLQRTGVIYRPLQEKTFDVEMSVIWRKDDTSLVLHEFLKVIQDSMLKAY